MQTRVDLQPAYVLHARPYRETSMLVDFITPEFGHISTVVKGARSHKTRRQSLLQPFGRLLISWQGKKELKTLLTVEDQYARLMLHGDALFSGMYINELLIHMLKTQDHCELLFDSYESLVQTLATEADIEPPLRCFEMLLLEELGYGIPFPVPAGTGISTTCDTENLAVQYYYADDGRFIELQGQPQPGQLPRCFSSSELEAVANKRLDSLNVKRAAKRLMRLAFTPLLGGRTLRSRELFKKKGPEYER